MPFCLQKGQNHAFFADIPKYVQTFMNPIFWNVKIFFPSGNKSWITMELFSPLINAVVGHVTAKGVPLWWRELQPKGSCREFLTALGLLRGGNVRTNGKFLIKVQIPSSSLLPDYMKKEWRKSDTQELIIVLAGTVVWFWFEKVLSL